MPGCGGVSAATVTGLPRSLRSHRREVHADDAVSARRTFFGGAVEAREPRRHARLNEPGGLKGRDELCFQQSTGDSTGPQVDVLERLVWKHLANHDVRDLDAASGFEDAGDLGDRTMFIRYEIQDAVGDDDVDAA